jgi:hypothetical protein
MSKQLPHLIEHGADEKPESATCPWFYDTQPFVANIRSLLVDYEEGRLGTIWNLDAPLVDYLQAASAEHHLWAKYQRDNSGGKISTGR